MDTARDRFSNWLSFVVAPAVRMVVEPIVVSLPADRRTAFMSAIFRSSPEPLRSFTTGPLSEAKSKNAITPRLSRVPDQSDFALSGIGGGVFASLAGSIFTPGPASKLRVTSFVPRLRL